MFLKPLLAKGIDKFFAICPAFRKGEKGRHHLPQFTIMEWYRSRANYKVLMTDCEKLLAVTCRAVVGGERYPHIKYGERVIDLSPPFEIITIREAFEEFAGWNPIEHKDEKRFEEDFVLKVEPALPENRPVFLTDFPAWAASLSRLKKEDKRVSERFELFVGGLELANGFSELVDPMEQKRRFEAENKKRMNLGLPALPMPDSFISSLKNCPPSAGIALGLDRLVMLLTDSTDISRVAL